MLKQRKAGIAAVFAAGAIISLITAAVTATAPAPDQVKIAPLLVSADQASLSGKAALAEAAAVWRLFDRDTDTGYAVSAASRIIATLPERKTVSAVRVFGPSSCSLTVYRDQGSAWVPVPSLTDVSLARLAQDQWHTLAVQTPVAASKLLFEFAQHGSGAATVAELEIQGEESAGAVETKAYATLASLSGAEQMRRLLALDSSHIHQFSSTPAKIDVQQGSGAFVTVLLAQEPMLFKRAYLSYEAYDVQRSVSLRRRINDQSWSSGFDIQKPDDYTPAWTPFIEEINPAWLVQGDNRIAFQTLSGTAQVRNLTIVVETDSGWNAVSSLSAASLYDGDVDTAYDLAASSSADAIEITFDRPSQPESLRLHMPGPANVSAGLQYRTATGWQDVKSGWSLDLSTLRQGWNSIALPAAVTTDALRIVPATSGLRLKPGIVIGSINELRVNASPSGSPDAVPRIVVSYPRNGEYFGRTAVIQGFGVPTATSAGRIAVEAAGNVISAVDGSFGATITKEETQYANDPDDQAWKVTITSEYGGQAGASATLFLGNNSRAVAGKEKPNSESRGEGPFTDNREKHTEKVAPGQAKKITYKGVTLDIPAGAVDAETDVTIIPLTEADLAHLNPGMVNVTFPAAGYRFLPHGMKFKKPIKISFGYSKTLFAAGQKDDEVSMYYYDESYLRWVALKKLKVDAALSAVESESDHFTDIINSTLVVPEHPQALSFNPNSLKDIKAADPSANVNLIEPPKGNNKGTANLSYPIETPPGRNRLQPGIGLQYSSGGGNGWMGIGWDIPVQAISIDTRWGVPRYYGDTETETYTLDGEQLAPQAHRGERKLRTDDTTTLSGGERVKIFHPRVEGQFRRIIRHGSAPNNYWWEVIDKNGTKYFYGGKPGSNNLPNSEAVLAHPSSGNIFKWALREVRDTNGNTIKYTYSLVTDTGLAAGAVPGYQLYLKEINYTGHNNGRGKYSVIFTRDREDTGFVRRTDVIIDARSGFKMVTADLLKKIEVFYGGSFNGKTITGGTLVRRYEFNYNENPYDDGRPAKAFHKTLLTSVTQHGKDGGAFTSHRFAYYDDARRVTGTYNGFAPATNWPVGDDGVGIDLMGEGTASALGATTSSGWGGHIYIGIGAAGNTTSKQMTGGFKIGYSQSTSDGLLAMADMDGDGLPDKVYKDGGFYYRKNMSGPHGSPTFSDTPYLLGLPAISHEEVTTTTVGGEAYVAIPLMYDHNEAETEADTYFSDVNGDGLTDLVSGGSVLFGYVNADGKPVFSPNSQDTPSPITSGTVDTNGLIPDRTKQQEEREKRFPLLDVIRSWKAPYNGVVRIDAPVALIEDTSSGRSSYTKADGVQLAIQHEDSELWSMQTLSVAPEDPTSPRILANDYSTHTPTGVNSVPVQRGDRIYFRVQSVYDGAYDQVRWNPEITYQSVDTSRTDVNSRTVYRYKASEDFTFAGRKGTLTVPLTGVLRLAGTLEKTGITTDDITLLITKNGDEVYRRSFGYDATTTLHISKNVDVTQRDVMEWRILADSPIDVTRIKFTPQAYYTSAQGVDRVKDDQGNYIITVKPPYDIDLYPADSLTAPQSSWTAPKNGVLRVVPGISFLQQVPTPAEIPITVKKRGALLGKRTITLDRDIDGNLIISAPTFTVAVAKNDEVFFDFSARDTRLAEYLTGNTVQVAYEDNGPLDYETVPSVYHSAIVEDAFPQPYRGWGVVGYNGNSPRTNEAIDQSLLVLTGSYDPENARVYPFAPMPEKSLWGGLDEYAWVKDSQVSSSRLGLDDIRMITSGDFAGAIAPSRVSESESDAGSIGVGASKGKSESVVDFQDLNGDRFPDVLGNSGVQYTRGTGQLDPTTFGGAGLGTARKSENQSFNASTDGAGNIARAIGNAKGDVAPTGQKSAQTGQQGSDMPRLGFGASAGYGTSDTRHELIDMNGDGLPDKVTMDGNVYLNLGYSFEPRPENWGGGIVNHGETVNGGVNMGFSTNYYSLAGGLNLGLDETRSDETYVDINGDGLPDKVYAGSSVILLNTGGGFTPITWSGGHGKAALDMHVSLGGGVYFTFGWNIYLVRIVINPGVNFTTSLGRPEYAYRDVDGDGNVDHLYSKLDSELSVALNPIGRTNLLKTVKRPLGGAFEISYQREGNKYEMPQSQWIMTGVKLTDGMGNTYRTEYQYAGPHHDRYERDFYGFSTVREILAPQSPQLRRTTTQTFHTNGYGDSRDFYLKGLLLTSVTRDKDNHVWAKSENRYVLLDVQEGGATLADAKFPAMDTAITYFYDGSGTTEDPAPKMTQQHFRSYDAYGNVGLFIDEGDQGPADDVQASIEYWTDSQEYIIKPSRIQVKDGGGAILIRHRTAQYYGDRTGNLKTLTLHNTKGPEAAWNMTYDGYGNIATIADPVGYTLTYTYDLPTSTHVTKIADNFSQKQGGPYYSTATYNLLFGQVETSTDLSGNVQVNAYDQFGRLEAVCGPYDPVNGDPEQCRNSARPTIAFSYDVPVIQIQDGEPVSVPVVPAGAVTRNKAVSIKGEDGDTLDTITFTDGMKRIIQTRKEADVFTGENTAPRYGVIASGTIVYDELGRVIEQDQPTFIAGSQYGYTALPRKNATTFRHDPLDRTTMVITPDGAVTTTEYGFDYLGNGGPKYAYTKVVDPEGNAVHGADNRGTKISYKDVDDKIQAVVEYNKAKSIVTTYAYDPLGQITDVHDNNGNRTRINYDDLGHRIAIDNPDTGKTEYSYDANGNLINKLTANYQPGRGIRYEYDFNRLRTINYPDSVDVAYEYGPMNGVYNQAGRIVKVTDESGVEERRFGRLGETIWERKTVEAHTPAVSRKVFTTEYVFDSFGRMTELTYPDGEKLSYLYDHGGLLAQAWGEKKGNRYDYITTLQYDEFGQRNYIAYGNGVRSRYTYNAETRRLSALVSALPASQGSRTVQNLAYRYDLVGNVLGMTNGINTPTNTALPAGPVSQTFIYDDLYQLTNAQGEYAFGPGKRNTYHNVLAYDSIGNITTKYQNHTIYQPSAQPHQPKETNYLLSYLYGGSHPHAVTDAGEKVYQYDAAGNMTRWDHKQNGTRRVLVWNEENRIRQISDNGQTTYFLYDDTGERVVKRGQHSETIYVNRFYSVRSGELGTKHVFAGETRVISKLVKTPNTVTANSGTGTGNSGSGGSGGNSFPNQGTDTALNSGSGKKLGLYKRLPDGYQTGINQPVEKDQFYFHGDHLGSSNMITDAYGAVYQHLEYFPFGETWIEEGGTYGGNTPGYKFTGKELDPETRLYYYGARYYDPVLSRWISADPILGQYLSGEPNGGVFVPGTLDLYGYSLQNPIRYKDEKGEFVNFLVGAGSSVLMGAAIRAIASGGDLDQIFDPKAMAIDAISGAVGVGIATKLNHLRRLENVSVSLATKLTKVSGKVDDIGEGVYLASSKSGKYVGQTEKMAERMQQHVGKARMGSDTKAATDNAVRLSVKGGKTSREVAEQRILDKMGGPNQPGKVLNRNNPVGGRRQLLDNQNLGQIEKIAVPPISRGAAAGAGATSGAVSTGVQSQMD